MVVIITHHHITPTSSFISHPYHRHVLVPKVPSDPPSGCLAMSGGWDLDMRLKSGDDGKKAAG